MYYLKHKLLDLYNLYILLRWHWSLRIFIFFRSLCNKIEWQGVVIILNNVFINRSQLMRNQVYVLWEDMLLKCLCTSIIKNICDRIFPEKRALFCLFLPWQGNTTTFTVITIKKRSEWFSAVKLMKTVILLRFNMFVFYHEPKVFTR